MIDFYCFENTDKQIGSTLIGLQAKLDKSKNIIIITSNEARVYHEDDNKDEDI